MRRSSAGGGLLAPIVALLLVSCGGGGGGGGDGGGGPPAPVAPTIITAPAPQSVDLGQSATFGVVAAGDAPLAYQWQIDGVDAAGATASQWTFTPTVATVAPAQVRVRVSNAAGSVTSAAADLTVRAPLAVMPMALAAGNGYTLAVRADGRVLAWGGAGAGQNGAGGAYTTPTLLAGIADARAVTADGDGGYRSLVLRADGTALGCGEGSPFGVEPTSGGTAFVAAPAVMGGLGASVQAVHCGSFAGESSVGAAFTYMRRADGTVAYLPEAIRWVGSGPHASSAAAVASLTGVVALVELHATSGCAPLAITADGALWKMQAGLADSFDAATGTTTRRYPVTPTRVAGLPEMQNGSCQGGLLPVCLVLARDGTVWAWGPINFDWLPGPRIGTTAETAPARMPVLTNIVQVASAGAVGFARDGDGQVWSWSASGGGVFRLGRGNGDGDPVPRPVALPARAVWIAASISHAAALLEDGTVWTWGRTQNGQRGDGTQATVTLLPVQVHGVNLN